MMLFDFGKRRILPDLVALSSQLSEACTVSQYESVDAILFPAIGADKQANHDAL